MKSDDHTNGEKDRGGDIPDELEALLMGVDTGEVPTKPLPKFESRENVRAFFGRD